MVRVRIRSDLGIVAALALLALLLCSLLPSSLDVLRIPAAASLVLVLPGYALTAAQFGPQELRASERILLSLALSVVATILAALLLQLIGVRLRTAPWMGLLALVAVGGAVVGEARGHARTLARRRLAVGPAQLASLAAALALLGGAAALGFSVLPAPKGTQGATFLWILPHGSNAVSVGVIGDDTRRRSVTVAVTVAGAPLRQFGPMSIAPGARWTRVLATGPGSPVVRAFLRDAAHPSRVLEQVALRYKRGSG
jgi:hypothetical protein